MEEREDIVQLQKIVNANDSMGWTRAGKGMMTPEVGKEDCDQRVEVLSALLQLDILVPIS